MTNLKHLGEQKIMTQTAYAGTDYTPSYGTDYNSTPGYADVDEETPAPADVNNDLDESADDEIDESEGTGASAGPRAVAAKPNKAFIRKVAAKALEVADAPDSTRTLAAALLGSGEETVELTAAIMVAGRGAGQPLADISEIVTVLKGDEPWEAGVVATSLDGARQKAVWNILHTRGAVGTPTPPKSLPKAGSAIVKAINGLTDADKSGLSAAGDLLKRS